MAFERPNVNALKGARVIFFGKIAKISDYIYILLIISQNLGGPLPLAKEWLCFDCTNVFRC